VLPIPREGSDRGPGAALAPTPGPTSQNVFFAPRAPPNLTGRDCSTTQSDESGWARPLEDVGGTRRTAPEASARARPEGAFSAALQPSTPASRRARGTVRNLGSRGRSPTDGDLDSPGRSHPIGWAADVTVAVPVSLDRHSLRRVDQPENMRTIHAFETTANRWPGFGPNSLAVILMDPRPSDSSRRP
jgi:hypothetical protein